MPIERIPFERAEVFGFRAAGRIEAEDVDEIAGEIRRARADQKRLRLYAEIEPDWRMGPKAWAKDFLHSLRNAFGFRVAAIVTDEAWMARAARMTGWLPGLKVRTFPVDERETARTWIASDELATPKKTTD